MLPWALWRSPPAPVGGIHAACRCLPACRMSETPTLQRCSRRLCPPAQVVAAQIRVRRILGVISSCPGPLDNIHCPMICSRLQGHTSSGAEASSSAAARGWLKAEGPPAVWRLSRGPLWLAPAAALPGSSCRLGKASSVVAAYAAKPPAAGEDAPGWGATHAPLLHACSRFEMTLEVPAGGRGSKTHLSEIVNQAFLGDAIWAVRDSLCKGWRRIEWWWLA